MGHPRWATMGHHKEGFYGACGQKMPLSPRSCVRLGRLATRTVRIGLELLDRSDVAHFSCYASSRLY